jgi:hypothetical protein
MELWQMDIFRPMVERSLAWLVRPGRRVAYRGLARNRIWLAHRAAAVNLQRPVNLGLDHRNNIGWHSPHEPVGPGADKQRTTPTAICHPARPTHTLNIGSSVGHVPGPTSNATPSSHDTKESVAQQFPSAPDGGW